ncbi:transposase [Sorangium sp. So ce1097]|uniref:transposase n=1 Tax=Sorangium sp. So ce1097 TaxID=3133330 RepID=UPI003F629B80
MERWLPPVELSRQEQALMKRLTRVRALFGFLRLHRHELFDETFQEQLESMYRTTGAGEPPHPPALMCMVTLLQGYVGASDAEAVELSIVDLRWQMVLGCLGAATPAFSQGALQAFRERMVEHEMDRVLLERTVALVRSGAMTEGERRAVSKALRVAIDSRPLAGAGRVEDTINLLGHAARSIVRVVSKITDRPPEEICRKAGIPLLLAPSIKAGLDLDWSDPKQKAAAIQILERQVSSLQQWVDRVHRGGRGSAAQIPEAAADGGRSRRAPPAGAVEHALAHIAARKGHTARYIGARRNLFDLRRAAAIQNLEAAQRLMQQAA